LVAQLQDEFDTGKRQILEVYRVAVEESTKRQRTMEDGDGGGNGSDELDFTPSNNEGEISNKTGQASAVSIETEGAETEKSSCVGPPSSVRLEVCGGPHSGETYLLEPRIRKPCFIGRSKSKKFCERGVSLYRDTESSTTHGKFHVKADGKFYYTDSDSTNGTLHRGKQLEGCVPLLLSDGVELLVGASLVRVSLVR